MVLANPDEARRQRILLKRQQAKQENNERDLSELKHVIDNCDNQEESEKKNPIAKDSVTSEVLTHNNKRKLDIPDDETIVANVYRYLQQEYKFMKLRNTDTCNLGPLAAIKQRTVAATGLPERYVRKVLKKDRLRMEKNKRERNKRLRIKQNDASSRTPAINQEE